MNWQELASGEKAELVKHWQRLGQFRAAHPVVAAGSHKKLADSPMPLCGRRGDDKVVVVFAGASRNPARNQTQTERSQWLPLCYNCLQRLCPRVHCG